MAPTTSIERLKAADTVMHMRRRNGLHSGNVNTATILMPWKSLVLPKVKYGLHLVPMCEVVRKIWAEVKKTVMVTAIGCFSEKMRKRLRTLAGILTSDQIQDMQMYSLRERLAKRSTELSQDAPAQADPKRLAFAQGALRYSQVRGKSKLLEQWQKEEKHRARKLPWARYGALALVLTLMRQAARRAGVQWNYGTFLCRARERYEHQNNHDRE